MFLNELSVRAKSKAFEEVIELLEELLSLWEANNQILEDYKFIYSNEDNITILVNTPEQESLKINSLYIESYLKTIKDEDGLTIKLMKLQRTVFGGNVNYENDASHYILFPGLFSVIRSGDNFDPIPVYRMINKYFHGHSFDQLRFWKNNYLAIDGLWRRGDINESNQYYQLSHFSSELSLQGREVCNQIIQATGKKCYYYLFNYPEDIVADFCPKCGNKWKLNEVKFGLFKYQCDNCLIIS